ncbi:MAG: hypothetical protein QGG64_16485 [Candidatus Latescibacteria bacterium]|jgi:hypothetical protein|nr:hypothetical protein [Candidatus Latescibacterota bacterium]
MAKLPKNPLGPMQVVAHKMAGWTLMLSVGMGGLSLAAFYYGLLVVGSMLISIFLVAITLYFFLKLWPEDPKANLEKRTKPQVVVPQRPAMVSAVRIEGPPKARAMIALREMVRRQESFQISQQGAEAFAKTIRFMLRSQR